MYQSEKYSAISLRENNFAFTHCLCEEWKRANYEKSENLYIFSTIAQSANSIINPFLPAGQFMAPKLIILIQCLIDILFFKVLF